MSGVADLIASIAPERAGPVPPGVQAFLQARAGSSLLRRAGVIETPAVPAVVVPDDLAALQAKFNAFKYDEKGKIAQLASQFLRGRTPQATPGEAFLNVGMETWFQLAIVIGAAYRVDASMGLNERRTRETYDQLERLYRDAAADLEVRMLQHANFEVAAHLLELDDHVQATLAEERDLLTGAADHAQADASQARRELEAASAQLARERRTLGAEIERLQAQLATERQAVINRDREIRNQIHQLEADKTVLQASVAHLNQECERLDHELKERDRPKSDLTPTSALERASLCAYLRARGATATWSSADGVTCPDVTILAIDLQAWRAAYPTPDAMLAQVHAVVQPILNGRAA